MPNGSWVYDSINVRYISKIYTLLNSKRTSTSFLRLGAWDRITSSLIAKSSISLNLYMFMRRIWCTPETELMVSMCRCSLAAEVDQSLSTLPGTSEAKFLFIFEDDSTESIQCERSRLNALPSNLLATSCAVSAKNWYTSVTLNVGAIQT